jgi:hypothetical protein
VSTGQSRVPFLKPFGLRCTSRVSSTRRDSQRILVLEELEDEAVGGVSLKEWCKDQRLHSHQLDQNVEGWA